MIWDFLIGNIPSWNLIFGLVPSSLVYSFSALYLCGRLKVRRGWHTGYSRKLFHFTIFAAAGVVQVLFGYPGTIVFGSSVSLIIFLALYLGEGHLLFEAMAREKDAPKKSHYILMPYLATLSGGVLNNFLFPPQIAVFGYLVTGFGDAIAEPVGTRFGRHVYRVPSFTRVASFRSLEGSVAVLGGSFIALITGGWLAGMALDMELILRFALVAIIAAAGEAVSPHGWDNFTLQVLTGAVCWFLIF